jgi:hypothetical protein
MHRFLERSNFYFTHPKPSLKLRLAKLTSRCAGQALPGGEPKSLLLTVMSVCIYPVRNFYLILDE